MSTLLDTAFLTGCHLLEVRIWFLLFPKLIVKALNNIGRVYQLPHFLLKLAIGLQVCEVCMENCRLFGYLLPQCWAETSRASKAEGSSTASYIAFMETTNAFISLYEIYLTELRICRMMQFWISVLGNTDSMKETKPISLSVQAIKTSSPPRCACHWSQ